MREITLCAFLLAAPQFLSSAPALNESSDGVVLEGRERLISGGDPTEGPVRFFIMSEDSPDIFSDEDRKNFQDVEMWQIQIFDSQNNKVSYIQGNGRPAALSLPWNGLSASGELLPNGFYKARLAWVDSTRQFHATPEAIVSLLVPLAIRDLAGLGLKFAYTLEGLAVFFPDTTTFSAGNETIQAAAKPALDAMTAFIKLYPASKIVVRGYTDSTGKQTTNLDLSKKKALAVYSYFRKNNIKARRLAYEGRGSDKPISSNATGTGRTRNNRVEVVILRNASEK